MDSGVAGHSDGGKPCTSNTDCSNGYECGFLIVQGCSAQGVCVVPKADPNCSGTASGCTCTGQTVNLACDGYPSEYAPTAILHAGICAGAQTYACTPFPNAPPIQCNIGSQVCQVSTVNGALNVQCIDFPLQCAATPTCACVQLAESARQCYGDDSTGIRINL
jgi:hypothetical protein